MEVRAHVIGLGKSGIAAARLLKREQWQVEISDLNHSPTQEALQQTLMAEGIPVRLGHTFEPDPELHMLVVSPGVPWDLPAVQATRQMGIITLGEMELAWRSLEDLPWVGITGTNGKTTTTALTAAIFQAAGFHAPACGNIGYAACELALAEPRPDWVIAELSSYQIEAAATLAPRIGVWTTFTPDHLSRHRTLENYYAIKASLLDRSLYTVLNGDDPYLRQHAADRWHDPCWTSVGGKEAIAPLVPTAWIEDGWVVYAGEPVVEANALRMVGSHNQQNLLMAVAAARIAGIATDAITQAVHAFPGVSHRLERVLTWQGIDFINDSKATNYDAAEVGLRAVEAPVVLIAGGDPKEGDDTGWVQQIQAKAATVLLIGDAAPVFARRLEASGYSDFAIVETMDRAVQRATEIAPGLQAKVVLLSPACASFDQYPNFEARGDHFRQLCLAIGGPV